MTKIYQSQLIQGSISSQMILFDESEGLRKHYHKYLCIYIYTYHILIYLHTVYIYVYMYFSWNIFSISYTINRWGRGRMERFFPDPQGHFNRLVSQSAPDAVWGIVGWVVHPPKKPEILLFFSLKHQILRLSNFDPYPSGWVQPSH